MLSTPSNDYACLVGRVLSIDKVGTPEHGTDNPGDDIHVNFMSMEYSENRMREIEQMLGDLYGRPTSPGIMPPVDVDDVIMAPDMLYNITGIGKEDLAAILDSGENAAAFAVKMGAEPIPTPAQAALHEPDMFDDEKVAALRDQLIGRLDENFRAYLDTVHSHADWDVTGMSSEIAAYAGAHYYLSEIHNFHASELEYLLQFQNLLQVVADKFQIAGMDDHSDIMWEIFNIQDALQQDYELVAKMTEPTALEAEYQLRARLADNYSDYKADMLSLSKEELFNAISEAASTQQVYDYLTEQHYFTNAEVDFLLKFENPLDVVSDRWDTQMADVGEVVTRIFQDEKWTTLQGGYALMPEEAPSHEAGFQSQISTTEKPSVLEQIRKARDEAKNNPPPRKEAPGKDNGLEI